MPDVQKLDFFEVLSYLDDAGINEIIEDAAYRVRIRELLPAVGWAFDEFRETLGQHIDELLDEVKELRTLERSLYEP